MRITIQYHDLVLLGILSSLLLGVGVGFVTPVSTAITVPLAALLGIAIMYQTLFLRGSATEGLAEEAGEIEIGE